MLWQLLWHSRGDALPRGSACCVCGGCSLSRSRLLAWQVQALATMVSVKQAAREDPANIGEAEAYRAKKTAQLQKLRGAALASEGHQQLSAWCVQHC